jgi:hypothetical protein
LRRTLGHLTGAASSLVRGLSGAGDADVFLATSPPLFTGLVGLALARRRFEGYAALPLALAGGWVASGAGRRLEERLRRPGSRGWCCRTSSRGTSR